MNYSWKLAVIVGSCNIRLLVRSVLRVSMDIEVLLGVSVACWWLVPCNLKKKYSCKHVGSSSITTMVNNKSSHMWHPKSFSMHGVVTM